MNGRIISNTGKVLKKLGIKLRKAAPAIMVGVGVGSVIGGTIFIGISATKAKSISDEHDNIIENIDHEDQKEVRKAYFNTLLKFLKLFAPGACAVIFGLSLILGSHTMLQRRNTMLTAQLFAVTQAFNQYRGKVKEEYGVDKDMEFAYGDKVVEDPETGEKLRYATKDISDQNYVIYFCAETSKKWVNNAINTNLATVQLLRNAAQNKLEADGHLFLGEVLRELGYKKTKKGYTDGWIFTEGKIIEFNCEVIAGEMYDNRTLNWENDDRKIRIEFNIDGPIIDKLDLPEE